MKEETSGISFDDLNEKVSLIYNAEELDLINKAFTFANDAHQNQIHNTGEEFIVHPLNIAYILADLNVDSTTIIAALLHETITIGKKSREDILENFSEEVLNIIENVNKINRIDLQDETETAAVYMRKVLVGLAEDVRVLFIKLADRLHNMRTLWALKPSKQLETANETMTVLIPIAHRLGINSIKSELEDLCLQYTQPEIYSDILNKLNNDQEYLEKLITEMKETISDILSEHGLKIEIKGRVKSINSIYKKLITGRKFSDIYDILALRVFVETESDCYLAMGLIHARFRPIPKRFKDYIAMPKRNMYQSLHTTVFGIDGELYEIQIRTHEMDEIAEKGIASHWSYKEKGSLKTQALMEQKLELFRNLIELNKNDTPAKEFVDNINKEFLSELIYVYTPKGDVVELPSGATPIDFAYRIHSNIGDKIIGALANDKIISLDSALNDGDIVKINTNNNSTPSKEWLKIVKTSQAKSKIKAFFSKQDRADYIQKGEELLEKELKKRKLNQVEVLNEDNIQKITKELKAKDWEDVLFSIGTLRHTASYLLDIIIEGKENTQDLLIDKALRHTMAKEDYKNDVIVAGVGDIKVSMAKCCKPIQGDAIIGYITKGEGISVHKIDCLNIKNEQNRLIEVEWNEKSDKFYLTDIYVKMMNNKNYLLDIINKAGLKEIHIQDILTINKDIDNIYKLSLKLKNTDNLESFINELQMQKYILEVGRDRL